MAKASPIRKSPRKLAQTNQKLEEEPEHPSASQIKEEIDVKSDPENLDNESVEHSDDDTSSDRDSGKGNIMLDVLAQVAAATLEKDEPAAFTKKKLTARNIQSFEVMSLDQIAQLTDKQLVMMFSDMTSNEIRKNYTYTCFLMPNKCNADFTSFGNENRAKLQVRAHLLNHVSELVDEANTPGRKLKFTAEPVPARKRRIAAEQLSAKKRKRQRVIHLTPLKPGPIVLKSKKKDSNFTSIKPADKSKAITDSDGNVVYVSDLSSSTKKKTESIKRKLASPMRQNIAKKFASKKKKQDGDNGCDEESCDKNQENADTQKIIRENEQFILDLLSRNQPYHDHSYTTIFGSKTVNTPEQECEIDSDAEGSSSRTRALRNGPLIHNSASNGTNVPHMLTSLTLNSQSKTMTIPIVRLERLQIPTDLMAVPVQLVSSEEIVQMNIGSSPVSYKGNSDGTIDVEYSHYQGDSGQRPYPPMPKSIIAKRGKLPVPEESTSATSSDEDGNVQAGKKKKRKLVEGSAEWERKMALRYIRELRSKKHVERSMLVCRLCKDKSFTAAATLMYHYRSHAGIKPFVCLICNTTFTRQHSLNYHMLIHNNQSRFTCKECGRKFRHPSHFKEHLRRHTGETPFECTDCPLKFKTRNTYKRHLKTRHGKLLTASGIYLLSPEEFSRVRTKPYNRNKAELVRKGEEDELVDVEGDECKTETSSSTEQNEQGD